eukprot:CAMPEP_0178728194 /NCGR_PEP_ID=MMETSP0699-20121125/28282_1 /TAXON_ID=265572 /ORGANISM="Extubocellulus spinifer, Strain CCMP396" /LENGTH=129 /DNA_ID=CAMNT_0020379989 /DNA_START=59 /DNA_END=448 /DNA_ORIENTATION=-
MKVAFKFLLIALLAICAFVNAKVVKNFDDNALEVEEEAPEFKKELVEDLGRDLEEDSDAEERALEGEEERELWPWHYPKYKKKKYHKEEEKEEEEEVLPPQEGLLSSPAMALVLLSRRCFFRPCALDTA